MISVIICTYNRSKSLSRTLKSLEEISVPLDVLWELIVVDNNSSDDTRGIVTDFARTSGLNVRYVFEGNQGVSHARNTGIQEAKGDIVSFTDDDVTVDPYWLRHIKSAFDQFDCMGVGGKVVPVWTCRKPSWLVLDGPYRLMRVIISYDLGEAPLEIKTPPFSPPFGANMSFKKVAFEKYGLFRIDLGKTGKSIMIGEDTEFSRRLMHGGERLIYAPQAIVYHPVDMERTEKRYFRLWYFNHGRTKIRMNNISKKEVFYFGIPGYYFINLFKIFLKWTFTFNSQRRFYYKLQLYQIIGQIFEWCYISRKAR